ncbi:unnamed protein product [Candidula unifasciata]|uniref:Uncharacterized protein n=1 Tax=Candidula unifasciata TaxID=100452 RepID=A0A8S3ZJ98_9EUPU|nr:unnamed protein product [Candidula unifasciata]
MAARSFSEGSSRKVDYRVNEVFLKQKVQELEHEVSELKQRLDGLRKAKNTTVIKRQREVLETGTSFGKREPKGISEMELKRKLSEKDKAWQEELDTVRRKFEAQINQIKPNTLQEQACNHLAQLEFLRQRNEELANDNIATTTQNRELRERVDTLLSELSIKEAGWCEMEEKFKLELKTSWGEKYKIWMEQMEAKITELQRTNILLRTYLKNHRPDGPDPTGQNPNFDSFLSKNVTINI